MDSKEFSTYKSWVYAPNEQGQYAHVVYNPNGYIKPYCVKIGKLHTETFVTDREAREYLKEHGFNVFKFSEVNIPPSYLEKSNDRQARIDQFVESIKSFPKDNYEANSEEVHKLSAITDLDPIQVAAILNTYAEGKPTYSVDSEQEETRNKALKGLYDLDSEEYAKGGAVKLPQHKKGDKVKMFHDEPYLTVVDVIDQGSYISYDLESVDGEIVRGNIPHSKIITTADKERELAKKRGYMISRGYDHYKQKPLFQVVGIGENDEFVSEWYDSYEEADEELKKMSKDKYSSGGRIKSAIARDRKYTSDEPHELAYRFKRKSKVQRYDSKFGNGGEVTHEMDTTEDIINYVMDRYGLDREEAEVFAFDYENKYVFPATNLEVEELWKSLNKKYARGGRVGYSNDPKIIESRFDTTCAETGKKIAKGQECVYYPSNKKCYSMDSKQAEDFRNTSQDWDMGYTYANGGEVSSKEDQIRQLKAAGKFLSGSLKEENEKMIADLEKEVCSVENQYPVEDARKPSHKAGTVLRSSDVELLGGETKNISMTLDDTGKYVLWIGDVLFMRDEDGDKINNEFDKQKKLMEAKVSKTKEEAAVDIANEKFPQEVISKLRENIKESQKLGSYASDFYTEKEPLIRNMIVKCMDSGLPKELIRKAFSGFINKTEGESENDVLPRIDIYTEEFIEEFTDDLIKSYKENYFEAGFKYMDISEKAIKDLGFVFIGVEKKDKTNPFTNKSNEYSYDTWYSKKYDTAFAFEEGKVGGGYSGIFSADLEKGYDCLKAILSKATYVKDVDVFFNYKNGEPKKDMFDSIKKKASVSRVKKEAKKVEKAVKEDSEPKIMHGKGTKRYVSRGLLNRTDFKIGDEVILLEDITDVDLLNNKRSALVRFIKSGKEENFPISNLTREKPKSPAKTATKNKAKGSYLKKLNEKAKEIRKEGESYADARKRAVIILKGGESKPTKKVRPTKPSKTTSSTPAKKTRISKIKKMPEGKRTDRGEKADGDRQALPVGKRISKKGAKNQHGTSEGGKVYYEYRENKADATKGRPIGKRFKKGGVVNKSIKIGDKITPYPYNEEFIIEDVFKNKDGEISYKGKFKGESTVREFILNSKDKIK